MIHHGHIHIYLSGTADWLRKKERFVDDVRLDQFSTSYFTENLIRCIKWKTLNYCLGVGIWAHPGFSRTDTKGRLVLGKLAQGQKDTHCQICADVLEITCSEDILFLHYFCTWNMVPAVRPSNKEFVPQGDTISQILQKWLYHIHLNIHHCPELWASENWFILHDTEAAHYFAYPILFGEKSSHHIPQIHPYASFCNPMTSTVTGRSLFHWHWCH